MLFLDLKAAQQRVPTLKLILRRPEDLTLAAESIVLHLSQAPVAAGISAVPGFSQTGSGSLPAQNLPTTVVAISPRSMSAQILSEKLREYRPPILARIQNEQVLIDPRTLLAGEDAIVVEALSKILQS